MNPAEMLSAAARRRVGLEDFGDPPIEPALSVLVSSLEREARLHRLGKFLMSAHLGSLLQTRLRLTKAWNEMPAGVHGPEIGKPLFIVGMPRSGSTFLHELLAQDPNNRAPRVWEVMFPLAAVGTSRFERALAIRKAAACLWCFRRLARGADTVYPMRALTPHECVAIQSYTFLSQEFVSTCDIPEYEAYLQNTDVTPAYVWERRFLQYLQAGTVGRRWVLKSPDHAYGLDALFNVFPDAHIIQTHRNPVEVIKSSANLTRVLRGLYGPSGDPTEIRMREARVLADGTERFIRFRDSHPELANRFIDVKYTDLVSDPLTTARHIYACLGAPLTGGAAEAMRRLAASRARYSGNRASTEQVQLDLGRALEGRFERYCARFGLSLSGAGLRR